MSNVQAFPLTWPETMPRSKTPIKSQFKTPLNSALNNVRDSLRRFSTDSSRGLTDVVISSNVTLGQNKPADTGVAVWFVWDAMQVCIAVDRYPSVEDNLQAIHHVIEARRTELRHGGLAIVRATFQGFRALPAPVNEKSWRAVLGFSRFDQVSDATVDARFKKLAKERHPDSGGSEEAMKLLNTARDAALKELGAA